MPTIREAVARSLEGLTLRQAARRTARAEKAGQNLVSTARRRGKLVNLESALQWIEAHQIPYRRTETFGCVILSLPHKVELVFRPDGIHDWASRRRPTAVEKQVDTGQAVLF